MGAQIRTILVVVAVLVVVGAAGLWLHYGMRGAEETAGQAGEQGERETSVSVPPADKSAMPAEQAVPPSFDIVRVEPTGDFVAAGQAASKAHVMLLNGDEELESADANSIGEWAIVLDKPLAPGSYDLLLRATGRDGKGGPVDGDRVTVVIEGPGRTPLVALARLGQPTEVLQQPAEEAVVAAADASAAAAPDQSSQTSKDGTSQTTAEAKPADGGANAPAESRTSEDKSAGNATAEGQAKPATGETNQPQVKAAAADGLAASQPAQSQPGGAQPSGPQPGEANTGQPETVAIGSGTSTDTSSTTVAAASAEPSQAQQHGGGTGAPSEEQPAAKPDGNVSIKTVEVENSDRLMLSGGAEPGDAVRLYLNNEQLADVETNADGRWTLSSKRPMPPGRYELRADVVGDTGKVTARAEVKFDRVQVVAEEDVKAAAGQEAAASGQPGSVVTIVSHGSGSGTATSSGTAIGEGAGTSVVVIARGDSLWRIARSIYGKGVRHSVIFEANKNQIRNPNLIYPGQVFTIPVLEGENG